MSFFFQTSAENLSCQQHERQFRQFRSSKTSQKPQDSAEIKKLWNLEFSKYVNPRWCQND